MFKSFADVPVDQLPNNKKLHAHAFSVMYAVSSMVENLNDIECLVEILVKTGQSHGNRSVTIQQFDVCISLINEIVLLSFMGYEIDLVVAGSVAAGIYVFFLALIFHPGLALRQCISCAHYEFVPPQSYISMKLERVGRELGWAAFDAQFNVMLIYRRFLAMKSYSPTLGGGREIGERAHDVGILTHVGNVAM